MSLNGHKHSVSSIRKTKFPSTKKRSAVLVRPSLRLCACGQSCISHKALFTSLTVCSELHITVDISASKRDIGHQTDWHANAQFSPSLSFSPASLSPLLPPRPLSLLVSRPSSFPIPLTFLSLSSLLLFPRLSCPLPLAGLGWIKASEHIPGTTFVVRNLQPDTGYIFLVRAQNSHGLSVPSPVTELIRTKPGRLGEIREPF